MGVKGLALSTDVNNLMEAPSSLDRVWDFIQSNKLYEHNLLYNVNIPPCPTSIRITKQGGMYYCDTFVHNGGHMYVQSGEVRKDTGTDLNSDINTVRSSVISVTPLVATRTEMSIFEKLKANNL
jgi:broad specificity polyphosphatase/5'/3'-nucleotidase SurE